MKFIPKMDFKRSLKRPYSISSDDSTMDCFNSSTGSVLSSSHAKILRLKTENVNKFTDVVMMHLSFLMDLSEERFEELMDGREEKQGLFAAIKRKSSRECVFGSKPNHQAFERVSILINYLGKVENCQREGIFRLSGGLDRQRELREMVESGDGIDFVNSRFTVNDVATVFKSYLSELPEPLMLEKHFNAYNQISGIKNERRQIECLQLLNQLLPNENAILLHHVLTLLNGVSRLQEFNKMSPENLSLIFTPHLFIPRKIPIIQLKETAENLRGLVVLMINNSSTMFDYPPRWVKDAIKYSDDVELSGVAKKNTSVRTPFKRFRRVTNEDDHDDVVLNTHITFTDRQASKKAAESTTTEKSLSELYSYIQTLPESGKKKKLLKGFDSPITPQSNRKVGVAFKKFLCQRNIFGDSRVPIMKVINPEDLENYDPAIMCTSILLSDEEEMLV